MTIKHSAKNQAGPGRYMCRLCTRTFTQKQNLQRHVEKKHADITVDLRCRECGFEDDELESIEAHCEKSHSETARLNDCSQCEFSSYHEPILEAHVASVHVGKKCEFCSYVGANKYHLRRHVMIKHERTRSHKCQLCGFATFMRGHLVSHMKAHLKD